MPTETESTIGRPLGGVVPEPVAWGLLLVPAVVQLVLHLATGGAYGIFRDEYYYLACAERLAWGYVDQPPFSIWLLAGWTALFGDSVHSIRVLPALCSSSLVVLTGMVAAQLGGGRWAQLLGAVGAAIGAAGLVIGGFYSMNCYDLVVWTAAFWLIAKIAGSGDGRWWPWFGLVAGVGLFNKIGLLVVGPALAVGLLATQHRRQLLDRRLYLGAAIAMLFMAPYVVWNVANDWPTREFIDNAKAYKIAAIAPLDFLSENILEANPATVVLWIPGLVWLLLARQARPFRVIGVVCAAVWLLLVLQKSKPYYFAGAVPVLLAAGGVAWEGWTSRGRWQYARWVLALLLAAGFAVFLPLGLPVLSPPALATYQHRLGIAPLPAEVGHTSTLPQYFSDRFGWEELARTVAEVQKQLDPDERARAVLLGSNYGHAGALEYWAEAYDLPPAFSTHNSFWMWGPPSMDADAVVIATGVSRERLLEFFNDVDEVAVSRSEWALESRISVAVCRGPKRPIEEIWPEIRLFI
jgi:4-amino-4-deoxy-L-arabinose transferase-like glycosyltransferase